MPLDGEVLWTDDFEADTVGQAPAGWGTFIAWQQDIAMPPADNFAQVADVDGSKVVHFMGGTNPAQITRALPSGTTKVYVTARVKMTRQLGQNPGANHETLIGIRGTSGGANDEVRFGEIKGVISITAPEQWQNGPMPADWLSGKFTEVILGWHSFSSANIEVWMDDVTVSTGRVGCP
jgi:hypothetical protein